MNKNSWHTKLYLKYHRQLPIYMCDYLFWFFKHIINFCIPWLIIIATIIGIYSYCYGIYFIITHWHLKNLSGLTFYQQITTTLSLVITVLFIFFGGLYLLTKIKTKFIIEKIKEKTCRPINWK